MLNYGYANGNWGGVDWDMEFKNGKWYGEVYFNPSIIRIFLTKQECADWIVSTIKKHNEDNSNGNVE